MKNNKKTFLNELDQKLSSMKHEDKNIVKHDLSKNKIDLKKAWKDNKKTEKTSEEDYEFEKAKEIEKLLSRDKKEEIIKKRNLIIKIFSVLIFILISAIVFFISKDYIKNNSVDSEKVNIDFINASSVSAFKPFSLKFKIENKTSAKITDSTLTLFYPEGTLDENLKNELSIKDFKQSIENNSSISYKERLIFLGQEYSDKKIKYEFKYKLSGDKEIHKKTGIDFIKINTSPFNLKLTYNKKVNSKVSNNIIMEVTSNTDKDINGISLIVDLNNSFNINYSIPKSTLSNNIFYFDKIKSGETKKITLNGYFTGTVNEERNIKVRLLKNIPGSNSKILSTFETQNLNFKIEKKDLLVKLAASKNRKGEIIMNPGYQSILTILLRNNLSRTLNDLIIKTTIPDNFFNEYSVYTDYGFYDSNNDIILWDKNNYPGLNSISKEIEYPFKIRLQSKGSNFFSGRIKNPESEIKVTTEAVDTNNSNKKISYSDFFKVKLNTIFSFNEQIFEEDGKPIDKKYIPKLGVPIKYKIKWILASSTNDIEKPKVESFVPYYAKVIYTDKNLNYNPDNRIFSWKPEKIEAFSGYTNHPNKEVEFILEYTPTVQHSEVPSLILKKKITGIDNFTDSAYSFEHKEAKISSNVDHLIKKIKR